MENKPKGPVRVYEEFEPSTTWERNPQFDTLIVHLPDFKKEELKVQVTSTNKLRIRGERPLGNNRWSRFRKEFPIASNYDTNEISAKFESDALRIKHPKIIKPVDHQVEAEAPKQALEPQKSEIDSSQSQTKGEEKAVSKEFKPPSARYDQLKNGQEEASQEADPSSTTSMEKQPSKKPSRVGSASDDVAKTDSRKSSEQTSQEADASKITSTEIKQPSKKASKVGTADVTNSASKKSLEEKSTDDHFAEEGKDTSGAATMEKYKKLDDAAASEKAEKEAAGSRNGNGDKYRVEEIKQVLGVLVMEMKQQRNFMNMIVAFLVVLLAWIYARNAFSSIGKSND